MTNAEMTNSKPMLKTILGDNIQLLYSTRRLFKYISLYLRQLTIKTSDYFINSEIIMLNDSDSNASLLQLITEKYI